jgi:hypothetical protein
MPATCPTERVDFSSRGIRCAAWLTLPAGPHIRPSFWRTGSARRTT